MIYWQFRAHATFFEKFDITHDTRKLYKWFNLLEAKQFYEFHQSAIGSRQFVFSNTLYNYNVEKDELQVVIPAESKNYVRVGDGYYEYVLVPNKYNQLEKQLHPRKKGTILEDHNKDIFEHIPKYKAFCNVPDHVNYQQIISNCFNRYFEMEHEPEEGECPVTLEFRVTFSANSTNWDWTMFSCCISVRSRFYRFSALCPLRTIQAKAPLSNG